MKPIPRIGPRGPAPRRGELVHAGRTIFQADLFATEWDGRPALLKDFSDRPLWVRATWGRLSVWREARVLSRLNGLPGCPDVLARAPFSLAIERLDARNLPRLKGGEAPPVEFFRRADELLRGIHARGVGHGDVRRDNLLIGSDGEPYLVDFATGIVAPPGLLGAPMRLALRMYRAIDLHHLAKIKRAYHPDALDERERRRFENPPWYLRAGRALRRNTLGLLKKKNRYKAWRAVRRWFRRRFRRPGRS